jgi:hypothetical protein
MSKQTQETSLSDVLSDLKAQLNRIEGALARLEDAIEGPPQPIQQQAELPPGSYQSLRAAG